MRILMIIDGLPGGGAEKVLITLAQGFLSKGYQVSVFSLRDVCDYILPKGIEYKIIPDYSNFLFRKLTESIRRSRQLDKEITESQLKNGEFDLIISNLYATDRIVAQSKVLSWDRTWFCLHTVFSHSYLNHRTNFSRWIKRQKIKRLYKNRNLIAVSTEVLEDMKQTFNVTTQYEKVIYNPFDFSSIRRLAQEPCDLIGQNYLIHVGRLHKNKRQDRLLKAYAKSNIQDPLVILGQGSEEILKKLKFLANDLNISHRVQFKSFDVNPYPYIKHARMLVISSDSEGFGNVLIESLICQTPVVSTRCPGGPAEILSGDLSICLAELNSSSLSNIMRKIYNNPPIIPLDYLKSYDVSTICQQYIINSKRVIN